MRAQASAERNVRLSAHSLKGPSSEPYCLGHVAIALLVLLLPRSCSYCSGQAWRGGRALRRPVTVTEGLQTIFFKYKMSYMTWHTLPHDTRKLQATEARLDAIYWAARNGLKGDTLALAAGMRPSEYRQLCEFDPLTEMAEQKGRADGEMEISGILHDAARHGDAKAALEILKHAHGWTAKTALDINIDQTISVKHALEMAQQRVLEGAFTVVEQLEDTDRANTNLFGSGRDGGDGAVVDARAEERSAEVRAVRVSVGAEGDAS